MRSVERPRASLAALAVVALMAVTPGVSAEEPFEGPQVWRQAFGSDDVEAVGFAPADVPAGSTFGGFVRFAPGADVTDVRYQICEIGQVCFAIGVPMVEAAPGNWTFHTADLEAFIGRPAPAFAEGNRIGVQFFVYNSTSAGEEDFRFFPEGDECDVFAPDDEWRACQETHYFGVTIGPADRGAPAGAAWMVLVALGASAAAARGSRRA